MLQQPVQPTVIQQPQPQSQVIPQQTPYVVQPTLNSNYVATNLPSTAVVAGQPTVSYIP